MKRKISAIVSALFMLTILAAVLSSPAYSFWYGEKTAEGNPVVNVEYYDDGGNLVRENTEFDIQDKTCGELWNDDRFNPGIAQQMNTLLGDNDNRYPGVPPITISKSDKYWEGYTLLSCSGGGVSYPDAR